MKNENNNTLSYNTFKILSKIAIFMIKAVLNRIGLVT